MGRHLLYAVLPIVATDTSERAPLSHAARQTGTRFSCPQDGRLSWPRWLATYRDG